MKAPSRSVGSRNIKRRKKTGGGKGVGGGGTYLGTSADRVQNCAKLVKAGGDLDNPWPVQYAKVVEGCNRKKIGYACNASRKLQRKFGGPRIQWEDPKTIRFNLAQTALVDHEGPARARLLLGKHLSAGTPKWEAVSTLKDEKLARATSPVAATQTQP